MGQVSGKDSRSLHGSKAGQTGPEFSLPSRSFGAGVGSGGNGCVGHGGWVIRNLRRPGIEEGLEEFLGLMSQALGMFPVLRTPRPGAGELLEDQESPDRIVPAQRNGKKGPDPLLLKVAPKGAGGRHPILHVIHDQTG